MTTQYEKVNEPMVDKLYRVADRYERGYIHCPDPQGVAFMLRASAKRIEEAHARKMVRA